ncbi:unnamed protein product [Cylicocyclus nassatus]|uniref:Uncharacterized protein n=1 Tax=Cylicocyclus nassatus TaxID=53992 RepID=A0AA36GJ03_CYLNA|nr:unnamed protein product [Cylicocyclus nassatus]
MDTTQVLPMGVTGDGDFFRHSTLDGKGSCKITARNSILWQNAHTIMLDSSIAELCVAGQCTTDIPAWFAFQTSAGGTDPTTEPDGIQTPGWLQSNAKFNTSTYLSQSDGDLPQWKPKTQRIPLGPLFPETKEITFRCTVPQLRRTRRLDVYRVPATMIFSSEHLQVFRLAIIGGRSNAPATIKLRPFREWLDADQLGNKLCVQFC